MQVVSWLVFHDYFWNWFTTLYSWCNTWQKQQSETKCLQNHLDILHQKKIFKISWCLCANEEDLDDFDLGDACPGHCYFWFHPSIFNHFVRVGSGGQQSEQWCSLGPHRPPPDCQGPWSPRNGTWINVQYVFYVIFALYFVFYRNCPVSRTGELLTMGSLRRTGGRIAAPQLSHVCLIFLHFTRTYLFFWYNDV